MMIISISSLILKFANNFVNKQHKQLNALLKTNYKLIFSINYLYVSHFHLKVKKNLMMKLIDQIIYQKKKIYFKNLIT